MIALVVTMTLALPLPPYRGKFGVLKRDIVTGAAIAISIAGLLAYFLPNPLFRPRSAWALVLFGASLLLMMNIAWNRNFRHFVDTHSYKREVFRDTMRNFWSPVYGRYDNALWRLDEATGIHSSRTAPFVALAAVIAAGWLLWARRSVVREWTTGTFAALIAFQIALTLAFALCEPWPTRFSNDISGYGEFSKDVNGFGGVADILGNYVARNESLSWYGRHYPPGNLILLKIELASGVMGLTKSVIILLTALSAIPLYKLARELDLPHETATVTTLLFSASSSVLILPTINTTPMLIFPATMCLWMLVRGLKAGSLAAAAMLGVWFAFFVFFSFTASVLGLLMAITAAIGWAQGSFTTRNVWRTGLISLAVVAIIFAAIYPVSGFNILGCFAASLRGHHEQQGKPFDDATRYLLRSSGNVLAYAFSTIPLCILAVSAAWTMWRSKVATPARAIVSAMIATALLVGFAGLFYVETERIWIFLTPVLAIGAGMETARRAGTGERELPVGILLMVLLMSLIHETLLLHYR